MVDPESKKVTGSDPLLRRALVVVDWLRDPALPGLALMTAIAIAGAVAIYFGWRGIARTIYVPLQLPQLVSGALGGLAVVGLGLFLFDLQMARRELARERRYNADLLDEVASLVLLAPQLRRDKQVRD